MSKRESVVFQATKILKKAYHSGYGRSRHADKRNALANRKKQDAYTKDKIYSDKTYNSTKKTCVAFVKYCRNEFGIRYLNEIKTKMFRSFIEKGDFRTGKAYDPKTAATYAAEVRKLQNAYSKQNHENVKFVDTSYKKVCGQVEEKRKQMPREIHDKIVQRCYSTKYTNGLAFRTARNLGLRVREITNLRKKDFNFTKKGELEKVHIHKSKGGRQRDINASNLSVEQRKAVEDTYEYFKDKTRSNDRFFTNKTQAYEKAFTRARDFISKSYTHCGVHSLRKEFAKDFFKREISKKRDVKEVKKELAQLLGHNRAEIVEHYLK